MRLRAAASLAPAVLVLVVLFGGALAGALRTSLVPLGGGASLDAWRSLFDDPVLPDTLLLTLRVTLASTLVSAALALLIACALRPRGTALRALASLPVPVPHLLVATLAVLWLAPGGLADRALGALPVDLVRDPWGLGIVAVYVYKETPFLVLLLLSVMGRALGERVSTVAVSEANGFNPGFGCCDDPPTPSHAVELYGGPGQDTLNGGPFGEQFNGRHDINEGADTVHGGGGRDRIAGTRDADKIFGDAGDDLIDAQFGNDVVHGGPGKDLWDDPRFSTGRDKYFGDGGDDWFIAGGGPDRLDGGPGADYMQGGGGRDRIFGRGGGDGLEGEGGGDFLYGGPGADWLTGGPGFDHLFPGPGRNHKITQ